MRGLDTTWIQHHHLGQTVFTDALSITIDAFTVRVRLWAVQNMLWAGRCPKLGNKTRLLLPKTVHNCPKLPKPAQNCLNLSTDYESVKLILG